MKLYYDQRSDGVSNFGDNLNPWLWQRLLPDRLNQADGTVLVGLGTLLNGALPAQVQGAQRVLIFSTGVGYEQPLTSVPADWRIYCVRGPLSARALGLPESFAIADGGMLVRRLLPDEIAPSHAVAFMPHVHHAVFAGADWESICTAAGIHFIDPRWAVDAVLSAIQQSQLLITEAMHGAIIADALGVPWIPVVTSPRILSFKWQDWCASIRKPYRPQYLPPLVTGYPRYGRGLRSGGQVARHWGQAVWQGNGTLSRKQHDQMARVLSKIARTGRPVLSDRAHLETLTQRLEEKLAQLQAEAIAPQSLPC